MKRYSQWCMVLAWSVLAGASTAWAGAQSLSIAPHTDISTEPGAPFQAEARLRNMGDEPITVTLDLREYEPDYLYDALPYLATQPRLYLAPHATGYAQIQGEFPLTMPSGGYYAYLVATMQANPGAGQVQVKGEVASLISVTVQGDEPLRDEIRIARQPSSWAPRWAWGYPLRAEVTATNTGNIHRRVTGQLVLTPLQDTGRVLVGESGRKTSLPGTETRLNAEIGAGPPAGVYRTTVRVCWGPGRCTEAPAGYTVVLVWPFLAKLLLGLGGLWALNRLMVRRALYRSTRTGGGGPGNP